SNWPDLQFMPEYKYIKKIRQLASSFKTWFEKSSVQSELYFELLSQMLEYDSKKRVSAKDALLSPIFNNQPSPVSNCLEVMQLKYPYRNVIKKE
ncbi:hypothetical protein BB560_006602, partial [Smittium megazygosporum]